jgi:enamine deaminase RidA (YjgF/YER057c/UK114 family)
VFYSHVFHITLKDWEMIMITQLTAKNVREVPKQYQGIYVHGTEITSPSRIICLAGQIGVTSDGETLEGFIDQCHQAFNNVEALLESANMTTADILRITYYITDSENLTDLSEVRQSRKNLGHPPAVTTLVVSALAASDLLVEIEVTAAK